MNAIYKIKFEKAAAKYFKKLDKSQQLQVKNIVTKLSVNPFLVPGVKRLKGSKNDEYRIRFGSFRLLYHIENENLVIIILKIGPRGDIYKN